MSDKPTSMKASVVRLEEAKRVAEKFVDEFAAALGVPPDDDSAVGMALSFVAGLYIGRTRLSAVAFLERLESKSWQIPAKESS